MDKKQANPAPPPIGPPKSGVSTISIAGEKYAIPSGGLDVPKSPKDKCLHLDMEGIGEINLVLINGELFVPWKEKNNEEA